MDKKYSLTINGRTYPARFLTRVAVKAAERRGSINAMMSSQNEAELFEDTLWLASELIKAGARKLEKDEGIKTPEIPTADDLLDAVDFADLLEIRCEVLRVMNNEEPTVRAEGDPKNTDATPEN